jgi:hypothetical protein
MPTNLHETSRDAKVHTAKLRSEMQDLIEHLRRDIAVVDEPRAKAMFETSAEILQGLIKTYSDYDQGQEAAFKAR